MNTRPTNAPKMVPRGGRGPTPIQKAMVGSGLPNVVRALDVSTSLELGSTDAVPTLPTGPSVTSKIAVMPEVHRLTPLVPSPTCPTDARMAIYELSFLRMVDPKLSEVLSGTLTFIHTLFPGFLNTTAARDALENAGYRVVMVTASNVQGAVDSLNTGVDPCPTSEQYYSTPQDPDATLTYLTVPPQEVLTLMGTTGELRHAWCVSAIVITLMGKMLTAANYGPWFDKRWAAFCGSLGISSIEPVVFNSIKLNVDSYRIICGFFTSLQGLRRALFECVLTATGDETLPGVLCLNIAKYLRWTEMGHIGLINKYIFRYHPQLLFMRELRPHFEEYINALIKMADDNNECRKWCYTKILGKKNELDFLNRQKHIVLTSIAHEIGKVYSPTLASYRGTMGVMDGALMAMKDRAVKLAWATKDMAMPENWTPQHVLDILIEINAEGVPDEELLEGVRD